MDELKISSRLMLGIASKLIAKAVKKNFGYNISAQLNELQVTVKEDKAYIHVNADVEMNPNEIKKFVRIMNMDEE